MGFQPDAPGWIVLESGIRNLPSDPFSSPTEGKAPGQPVWLLARPKPGPAVNRSLHAPITSILRLSRPTPFRQTDVRGPTHSRRSSTRYSWRARLCSRQPILDFLNRDADPERPDTPDRGAMLSGSWDSSRSRGFPGRPLQRVCMLVIPRRRGLVNAARWA
jgi:hypothetical protein